MHWVHLVSICKKSVSVLGHEDWQRIPVWWSCNSKRIVLVQQLSFQFFLIDCLYLTALVFLPYLVISSFQWLLLPLHSSTKNREKLKVGYLVHEAQKCFTNSEVAAEWHELMIPQCIVQPSIIQVSEQLGPLCSHQIYHAPISHTRPSPYSP